MGIKRISGDVAAGTKQCMVANSRVQEEDENLRKRSQTSNDEEVILNYLRSNITQPCSPLELPRKEIVTVRHAVGVF